MALHRRTFTEQAMKEKYLWAAFAFLIVTAIAVNIYEAHKAEQRPYIVVRANCNDTMKIEADSFRISTREGKAYFIKNGNAFVGLDSINHIYRDRNYE